MKKSNSLSGRKLAACAGLFAACVINPSTARADIVWDNSSADFAWSTATNWDTNSLPISSDNVQINSPAINFANSAVFNTTATIRRLYMGQNSGNVGYLSVTGGTLNILGDNSHIGNSGTGVVNQSGGTVNVGNGAAGDFVLGDGGGSSGTYNLSAGALNIGSTGNFRSLIIAYAGSGALNVSGTGTVSVTNELNVGAQDGAGTLSVATGGTVYSNGRLGVGVRDTSNPVSPSNYARNGTITMSGGTLGTTNVTGGTSITMGASSGYTAKIQGYGTINTYSGSGAGGTLAMSAYSLLIADSASVAGRSLNLSGGKYTTALTTSNTPTSANTTAGFFAVNQGNLHLQDYSVTGSAATLNWGGPSGANALNLVNSAVVGVGTGSSSGTLAISLLASDNADVAPLGDLANVVGVWNMDFTGLTLNITSLSVHYDSALAASLGISNPLSDLDFYFYNGSTWNQISSTIDTTLHTALISGALGEGTYALATSAVPEPSTWALLVAGGGMLFFLQRRKAKIVSSRSSR